MVWVFMESTLLSFRTGSNFVPVFLGATMAYPAPMELQTQIEKLEARIAALEKMLHGGDATFDTITCKSWKVVDRDGKVRIAATTFHDGDASVQWIDKDEKLRIDAATYPDGQAIVRLWDKDEKMRISAMTYWGGEATVWWRDKDGKERIAAATNADGDAIVQWKDKDGTVRISAATLADGSVVLPTSDLK